MIDIAKAKNSFQEYISKYKDNTELGFDLKVTHTYKVAENAKMISQKLKLTDEDIKLAELIGILHDIGRFDELNFLKKFDSVGFDHATHGVKILFENNMIRKFIENNCYDEIIKNAINNHSRLTIPANLDERSLLHSKIIRDADKLDNFRVKNEEPIETIFPKILKTKEDIETSEISDKVYETIKAKKCIDIHDRKTVLDYWICILAFIFDLNFKESYEIVKEKDYINILIDKFKYNNLKTQSRMEDIRKILNDYIEEKITK